MLTVLVKTSKGRDGKDSFKNKSGDADISGNEEELAVHVNAMSKLFFDTDIKVMLDRQAREFEKVPEKRVGIWRYDQYRKCA